MLEWLRDVLHMRKKDPSFDEFRRLAADPALSPYEKTGFGDAYRKGKEHLVFADILRALPLLQETGKTVIDIGPGCADLPRLMLEHCHRQRHSLVFVDSAEMLAHIPDDPALTKIAARFPAAEISDRFAGSADVVIAYSVLHHVFGHDCIYEFFDASLALIRPGGQLLLGDIPNVSLRKRFFASAAGVAFHKKFMKTEEPPEVVFNRLEPNSIDDAVVLGFVARARAAGFDAYLRRQAPNLPFANRREDLVVLRP